MANPEHLEILKKGVKTWNRWRYKNPDIRPDLSGEDFSGLTGTGLKFVNRTAVDLSNANLNYAEMRGVKLRGARLVRAHCHNATLIEADLTGANLTDARLSRANFYRAVCTGADFSGSYMGGASLVGTQVEGASFDNCEVYGLSAWGLRGELKSQLNLVVTPPGEPPVTVDQIEVAQLVYTFLSNPKIRHVIDTVAKKAVLILGRFTDERKAILDAIREELRDLGYLPVLFDFEKPGSLDYTETVSTLAHLAKFVIADITDPKIVLEEVPHIVRNVAVPVQPLMLEGAGDEPVTLYNLRRNHRSLLDTYRYKNLEDLLRALSEKVIAPAEAKGRELRGG
jgi:Pentapeptide repeats (8 copies)